MTISEGSDLLKKVERYESAVEELRAAHEDVRDVLLDQILFERWRQLGADIGFSAPPFAKPDDRPVHRDLAGLNEQVPAMSDAWAR
jgi:hypothetical protein